MKDDSGKPDGFAGATGEGNLGGAERPDVEVGGSFTATELIYREPSGARALVEPEYVERVDTHVREGLPAHPESGQAYRDVRVHWRLGGQLGSPDDLSEGEAHGG